MYRDQASWRLERSALFLPWSFPFIFFFFFFFYAIVLSEHGLRWEPGIYQTRYHSVQEFFFFIFFFLISRREHGGWGRTPFDSGNTSNLITQNARTGFSITWLLIAISILLGRINVLNLGWIYSISPTYPTANTCRIPSLAYDVCRTLEGNIDYRFLASKIRSYLYQVSLLDREGNRHGA